MGGVLTPGVSLGACWQDVCADLCAFLLQPCNLVPPQRRIAMQKIALAYLMPVRSYFIDKDGSFPVHHLRSQL